MSDIGIISGGVEIGDPLEPQSITFALDGEKWTCYDIKTLKELVEKFQAYATRDKYVRDLEDRIKHLESIL